MKTWQRGYELDYLKSIELSYQEYNSYACSPFAQFKKNDIADALSKKTLILYKDGAANISRSKVNTPINIHGDITIAMKQPGDITIKHLIGTLNRRLGILNSTDTTPTWLYTWATDSSTNYLAEIAGFEYVGAKITTFGEVFSIWFRNGVYLSNIRIHPGIRPEDKIHVKKLWNVDPMLIAGVNFSLNSNFIQYANHYSNYNVKNAWSAFSLRGYSRDPLFIAKPIEMSKKWKKEHEHEQFELQDTTLRPLFPEVEKLIAPLDGEIHRIRLMRLSPGGGELERHTDQVDPDSGNGLGKIARLHFPIITAPEVIFTVWDHKDQRTDVNMRVGECWMLDTRKPHKVYNGSPIDRIHLVVDTVVTPKLLDIITS